MELVPKKLKVRMMMTMMILVSGFLTLYNVNCNLAFTCVVVGALITRGGSSVITAVPTTGVDLNSCTF